MEGIKAAFFVHPSIISKHNIAYDFEIFDLPKTTALMRGLTPWVFLLCLVYVALVFALQSWMKERAAFDLRRTLVLWNLSLAIFSIAGVTRQFPEVVGTWKDTGFYGFACLPDEHNYATSFWHLLFTLSKIVELGDTAFLVLRKKQLIFLHWFHHATVLFFSWVTFTNPDPMLRRGVSFNYLVHSLMYTYFAFAALGFKFPQWLSKSITRLQITQFGFGIFCMLYTLSIKAYGGRCDRPLVNELTIMGIIMIYLILFINFFKEAYGKARKESKKAE